MSAGHRDERDAQLAGSNRGLVGVADVTVTRVASSKTTTPMRRMIIRSRQHGDLAHWDR